MISLVMPMFLHNFTRLFCWTHIRYHRKSSYCICFVVDMLGDFDRLQHYRSLQRVISHVNYHTLSASCNMCIYKYGYKYRYNSKHKYIYTYTCTMNTSLGFFGGKYLQFMLPVAMGLCENKVPQNLMVRQYVPIRITHLGETFFFGGGTDKHTYPRSKLLTLEIWHVKHYRLYNQFRIPRSWWQHISISWDRSQTGHWYCWYYSVIVLPSVKLKAL